MDKASRIKDLLNAKMCEELLYSFWTHFPQVDLDAKSLAETSYSFYKELDLDFIKSMPNGMYSIMDWGCECDFSQIAGGGIARVILAAVEKPEDWNKLQELDLEKGSLGRELFSLKLLLQYVQKTAPVIATVFSPMTTAYKLSGGKVLEHLQTHPEYVINGLRIITETTCRFAQRAVELGCAGIFFATQMCTEEMMTQAGYEKHCLPYDLSVLQAVKRDTWFNVAHLHGNRILFDAVARYPVEGISWHVWETPPGVSEFLEKTDDKIIVGGFQRANISKKNLAAVIDDLDKMVRLTRGSRLILAPGCTVRHPCDRNFLKMIAAKIRTRGQNLSA